LLYRATEQRWRKPWPDALSTTLHLEDLESDCNLKIGWNSVDLPKYRHRHGGEYACGLAEKSTPWFHFIFNPFFSGHNGLISFLAKFAKHGL
jgi:hypothetical protein